MEHTQPKQWDWKNPTSPVITPVLALPATRYIQTVAKCAITMSTVVAVENQVITVIAVIHLMPSLLEVLVLEALEVGGRTCMKVPDLALEIWV